MISSILFRNVHKSFAEEARNIKRNVLKGSGVMDELKTNKQTVVLIQHFYCEKHDEAEIDE